MASRFVTSIAGSIDVWLEDAAAPTHTAQRGSICIRFDATPQLYLNTSAAATGTTWSFIPLTLTGSTLGALLLTDDSATALDIGSTGLTNLLRFITSNAAELIEYRGANPFTIVSGGLTITAGGMTVTAGTIVLPFGSLNMFRNGRVAADGVPDMALWVRKTYAAGASNTDFALPAGRSMRLVDAYIRSDGATGGSVQVQTAAGAANCTDAMVPGNANVLTRATQTVIANCTFAASATVRLSIAAGAPLGEAFLHFEPL